MRSIVTSSMLRVVVAHATLLAPIARADEVSPVEHLTPQSFAAVTVRPAALARIPFVQNYPIEVAEAATEDFLGLPLESVDRVTVVIDPPVGASPQYAVILNASQAIDFSRFRPEITEQHAPDELLDRPAMAPREDNPLVPWACLLDDQTLAIGPKLFLKRFIRGVDGSDTDLATAMRQTDAELNHLHAAVMLEPIRPFLDVGLMAAKQNPDLPPEAHKYLDGLLLLDRVVLTGDLSGERESSLVVYATDRSSADRVQSLLADGLAELRRRMAEEEDLSELREHPEAVVRAWASYIDRMANQQVTAVEQIREGDDAFVLGRINPGDPTAPMVTVAVVGVLVALLLPAVQAAREAARRNQSMNNLKQINLAWHNHHDVRKRFPAQAICAEDGTPLLSWRVAILPFIDEQALHEKFHLDEAWDSPHNRELIAEVPEIYLDPSSGLDATEGRTSYLGVAGPDAILTGDSRGVAFRQISDGTARTITIVQVADGNTVAWTKPADFDTGVHSENPFGGIGSLHPGSFLAGFADAHVESLSNDTDPETLRALMTISGGERVEVP